MVLLTEDPRFDVVDHGAAVQQTGSQLGIRVEWQRDGRPSAQAALAVARGTLELDAFSDGQAREHLRVAAERIEQPLAAAEHAVWLLPTHDFRRAAFDSRGSTWKIAGGTSKPEKALHNLLERDRMFTDRLRDQTRRLGLTTIEVDGTMTEDELVERVRETLGLSGR